MKEINENNIEAWFLDYFEGRLTTEEKKVLCEYLREHPELFSKFWEEGHFMRNFDFNLVTYWDYKVTYFDYDKVDNINYKKNYSKFIEGSLNYSIKFRKGPATVARNFKHQILDSIYFKNRVNWDNQCIAYLEGDLEKENREEFEEMLRVFPRLRKDLELFKKAVFTPEPIKFPKKASLYRKNVSLVYRIGLVVAAAAVALIIMFYPHKVNHPVLKPWVNGGKTANIHTTPADVDPSRPAAQFSPQSSIAIGTSTKTNKVVQEITTARLLESLTPMPSLTSSVMIEHSMSSPEIQPINRIYTAIYADMMERWQAEAMRENRSIVSTLVKPVIGLFGKAEETLPGHNPVSIWTLAEFTIKGFNTLTNNDLELKTLRDEQGRIRAFAFGNDNFKIAHLSKKTEAAYSEEPQAVQRENDSGPNNP